LYFGGVLKGRLDELDPDSPSRVAGLVAGSRLDSTSPDMDSASRRCSAETLAVQYWVVYKGSYASIVRLFGRLRRTLNRLWASKQGSMIIGDLRKLLSKKEKVLAIGTTRESRFEAWGH